MFTLTLRKKVILALTLVMALAFAGSIMLFTGILRRHIIEQNRAELGSQTAAIAKVIGDAGLDAFRTDLAKWKAIFRGRITIIDDGGKVILDSDANPATLENHRDRPEVKVALAGGEGTSLRWSGSLNTYMLYAARRTDAAGRALLVRVALPLDTLRKTLVTIRDRFLIFLLLGAVVVYLVGAWTVRRFFRPLERIVDSADRIADGEDARFPLMSDPDLRRLTGALNAMSEKLRGALDDLRSEREDLSRIVTSLPVGVILLDDAKKVRYINGVAVSLLDIRPSVEPGVPAERILPAADIYTLIEESIGGKDACLELDLPGSRRRFLRICARRTATGTLLVVTDLTEERALEQSRRDFIADAGHELQTPLTAVRAAAEYLLEEEDGESPQRKCLVTIIEQQERMTKLVDDLLLLSRVEGQPPRDDPEPVDLSGVVSLLVNELHSHPLAGVIRIEADITPGATVNGRREDLARAAQNVLENAVKYVHERFGSEEGGRIDVSLQLGEGRYFLLVRDNGVGITEESAARIFERFSRGDSHRARGRWGKGGYGLGLAIAKRIVAGYGGDIRLLRNDNGATFEIEIPALS